MSDLAATHEHPHGRHFVGHTLRGEQEMQAMLRVSSPGLTERWVPLIDEDAGIIAYVDPGRAEALNTLLNDVRELFAETPIDPASDVLARLSSNPLLSCLTIKEA